LAPYGDGNFSVGTIGTGDIQGLGSSTYEDYHSVGIYDSAGRPVAALSASTYDISLFSSADLQSNPSLNTLQKRKFFSINFLEDSGDALDNEPILTFEKPVSNDAFGPDGLSLQQKNEICYFPEGIRIGIGTRPRDVTVSTDNSAPKIKDVLFGVLYLKIKLQLNLYKPSYLAV
jgi:hypothetical protein